MAMSSLSSSNSLHPVLMETSKPHSEFALVREALLDAGHPTGGARMSALDRIEEQLEALQQKYDEDTNADMLMAARDRALEQLEALAGKYDAMCEVMHEASLRVMANRAATYPASKP